MSSNRELYLIKRIKKITKTFELNKMKNKKNVIVNKPK